MKVAQRRSLSTLSVKSLQEHRINSQVKMSPLKCCVWRNHSNQPIKSRLNWVIYSSQLSADLSGFLQLIRRYGFMG